MEDENSGYVTPRDQEVWKREKTSTKVMGEGAGPHEDYATWV